MPISKQAALQKMRNKGFVFDAARDFITDKSMDRLAQDAMVTQRIRSAQSRGQ